MTSSASISVPVSETASGAPLRNAPSPRSAVNSSRRVGSIDGADLGAAVDLERRATRRRSAGRARSSSCRRADRTPSASATGGPSTGPPPNSSASTSWSGNRSAMTARHIRSHSRSTSVTRSIAPFLSTRKPDSRRASWMSPARRTISMAVARKTGSGKIERAFSAQLGAATLARLTITHFHAAFGRALQHHFVHEAANEEDAAAARLEQVLGRAAIGQRRGIEAGAFVAHADRDARPGVGRRAA